MADIFISYSSKDRPQAEQLVEQLSSAGLSCWIDRQGIDLATNWSKEIVQAIDGCTAFMVLLSSHSVASKNVVREVSLAFEKNKKILPLDLEAVQLSEDLQYHLAGIQRAPLANIDAVLRALGKLGLSTSAVPARPPVNPETSDTRKSLMILPFEDLSPTADNMWFADGIVSELISALSNIKSLRVVDAQSTKDYKSYKGSLALYAREMSVRYFVQGDVRKFGDQLKIASRLLDIETGDHLWQDTLKGTMQEVFEMQEQVATNVVNGLKLHLTKQEEHKIEEKPTESTEAYVLYLKGNQYFDRLTQPDYRRALAHYEEAVRIDPLFTKALAELVAVCQSLFRLYEKDRSLLERSAAAVEQIRKNEGETSRYYATKSALTLSSGDPEAALRFAEQAVQADPQNVQGYTAMGFAYQALGRIAEEAGAWEQYLRLRPNDRHTHFTHLISLHELGDKDRLIAASEPVLQVYERYTRLNPDDYNSRVNYANILHFVGRDPEARREADLLATIDLLDGLALYNLACVYLNIGELALGMEHLRRAVAKGYADTDQLRRDTDMAPLRGTPEFEALAQELEAKNSARATH